MRHTSARPADRIEKAVYKYGDKLFRICLITLGNTSDAEDAVQETMIKYLQKAPDFENNEHEKAWLITVAVNQCKDILRYPENWKGILKISKEWMELLSEHLMSRRQMKSK